MPAPTHFQIRWRCHRHLIIHYSDALRPITAPACRLHPSLSLAPEDPASRSSPCPHHPPLCSTNPTLTLIPRDPSTHTSHTRQTVLTGADGDKPRNRIPDGHRSTKPAHILIQRHRNTHTETHP